jgi:hypothetical protein
MRDIDWKTIWREGIAPRIPRAGLEALRAALAKDSKQLVQSHTVVPAPGDDATIPFDDRRPCQACDVVHQKSK